MICIYFQHISGRVFKQMMEKQTSNQCKQQSKLKAIPHNVWKDTFLLWGPDVFLSTVATIYYLIMNHHQSIQNRYFWHKNAISVLVWYRHIEIFSTVITLTAAVWNDEIELVSNTDHLNKRKSYKFILAAPNSWACLKFLPSPPGIIGALEIFCYITAVL